MQSSSHSGETVIVGQLKPGPRPLRSIRAGEPLDLQFLPNPAAFRGKTGEIALVYTGIQLENAPALGALFPGTPFQPPAPEPGARRTTLGLVNGRQTLAGPPRTRSFPRGTTSVPIRLTAGNVARETFVLIQAFNRQDSSQPPAQTIIRVVPRR